MVKTKAESWVAKLVMWLGLLWLAATKVSQKVNLKVDQMAPLMGLL